MHILHAEHRAEPKGVVRTPGSIAEIEQPCTGTEVEVTPTNEERSAQVRKVRVVVVPAVLSVCTI